MMDETMASALHSDVSSGTDIKRDRRARRRKPAPRWGGIAAAAAALLLTTGTALQAQAPAPVAGEVLVVLASEQEGEMDPALANVPALRKPPFSAFRSMRVLSKPRVQLQLDQPVAVELPNGRTVQLELQERMADGRFKVKVSINKPNQKDYLPLLQVLASPGEPFFVAGQSHQGGTLVIGVKVGARAADPK
jgi:hypothetical protein